MENDTIQNNINEHHKKNNQQSIFGAIIIVGLIISFAILLKGTKPQIVAEPQNNQNTNTSNIREVSSGEHILGNINAPIKIVEYSDTGCPFCKRFHFTMHQIVEESNGQIAWVYRHFPILSLHPYAFTEAVASECASEQGGNNVFWNYLDQIYVRTESNNEFNRNDLEQIASDLNLNLNQFNECLDSGKYDEKIQQDILDGQLNGVRGTPSSFIVLNGEVVDQIEGAAPFESVQAQIQFYLNN